jgi:hypothetical protein
MNIELDDALIEIYEEIAKMVGVERDDLIYMVLENFAEQYITKIDIIEKEKRGDIV